MHKIFIKNERGLNIYFCIALIFLISLILCRVLFFIQPSTVEEYSHGMTNSKNLVFYLNFAPICIFMFLAFFVSNNFSFSVSLTAFLFFLLSLTNRFKILLRQDPLVPSDFLLGGEAFAIVKNMDIITISQVVAVVLVVVVICIVAIIFIKNKNANKWVRLCGGIICIILAFFLNKTYYASSMVYEELPVLGNEYFLVNNYNTKGFVYSFIYQFNTSKITRPAGYDKAKLEKYISSMQTKTFDEFSEHIKPHIVMVMGEAFTELSENPNINFTGLTDPLENYKIIKNNSISGRILVPHMGGGTADTEFDVLTGISTKDLSLVPYSFRLITKDFNSIASQLKNLGYNTISIHPGYSWFYNRINAYRYLGFDEMIFLDDFINKNNKGGYMSESDTIDKIIEKFEENLKNNPSTPLFEYCVTIQNHGPYNSKYGKIPKNFNSNISLTPEKENILSNYFEGIKDVDIELVKLKNYLENLDEPAVLVYFGDHMPSISEQLFKDLKYPYNLDGDFNEKTFMRTTPFIIWQNSAFKKTYDFEKEVGKLDLQQDIFINSNYLGTMLYELLGFSPTWDFSMQSNEMRRLFPVDTKYEYLIDGQATEFLKEKQIEKISLFKQWQYYNLYN